MKIEITVRAKQFKMIASGKMTEVYKDISQMWTKRLIKKGKFINISSVVIKHVSLVRNDQIELEVEEVVKDYGEQSWGAEWGVEYYVLKLGKEVWRDIAEPKQTSYEDQRKSFSTR